MNHNLTIIEKPDSITWDEIHDVIWKSHEENRSNGITMNYPSLTGSQLKSKFEGKAKVFVALWNQQLVGTTALQIRYYKVWTGEGDYGYIFLSAVLPDYQGKSIYRDLISRSIIELQKTGLNKIILDTNEKNTRMINIALNYGFKKVRCRKYSNHYSVVMVKWLDKCPYPSWYCMMRYKLSCCYMRLRYINTGK